MNNLTTLQIFLKDSPKTKNKNNKNLFKFLNLNYKEIIECNYYIQLTLLNNDNFKSLPKNIKNTPALLNTSNNEIKIGTYDIINYLIKLCEGEEYNKDNDIKQEIISEPVVKRDNSDSLRDFLLNEALADDTIEEPIDLNKVKDKENKYKLKQEQQKSTNVNLKKNMINTYKNNINNNNRSIDNLPRDEKNKYDNDNVTETKPISEYMSDDKDLEKFWQNMAET